VTEEEVTSQGVATGETGADEIYNGFSQFKQQVPRKVMSLKGDFLDIYFTQFTISN
jgi:hypothetical protein